MYKNNGETELIFIIFVILSVFVLASSGCARIPEPIPYVESEASKERRLSDWEYDYNLDMR